MGGGGGLSEKILLAIHGFEKSTTEPPCCFSSNNTTCYDSSRAILHPENWKFSSNVCTARNKGANGTETDKL